MTTQARSEITRDKILDAARDCFIEQGYDATGVAEICQRARVSKGAFYHHFPTKQALFLELLNRWLAGVSAQVETIQSAGATVPEMLDTLSLLIGRVLEDASGQVQMFLEFWTRAARDPAIWQATISPYHTYQRLFAGLIERGIAEESLRPVDPMAAAQAVVSMGVGLLLQAALDPQGTDWDRVAHQSVQMLLDGLRNREEL